jgi:hypothetical protein
MAELSDRVVEFVSGGTRTGILGFVVDDGQLVFTTHRQTPKCLALQRDPRVMIATRTGARYMGAARADEFGRRNAVPGEVAVQHRTDFRPIKVISGFDISD